MVSDNDSEQEYALVEKPVMDQTLTMDNVFKLAQVSNIYVVLSIVSVYYGTYVRYSNIG